MRSLLPAVAACLVLCSFAANFVAALAPPASSPPPAGTASAPNDDAAKHARRTACLKEAKSKKLVGAQKSAFIKDCIGTP